MYFTDTVYTEYESKHPDAQPAHESVMISGDVPFVYPVMFENIAEETVAKSALKTKGAAGPSGLDAIGWRHILLSRNYGDHGKTFRKSIAQFARIFCKRRMSDDSNSLESYHSCRLIALDNILE